MRLAIASLAMIAVVLALPTESAGSASQLKQDFIALYLGQFDNLAQATASKEDPATESYAHLFTGRALVQMPALGNTVVYEQIDTGGKGVKTYRQRLTLVISYDDHVITRSFIINQPEAFEDAYQAGASYPQIGLQDVRMLADGCDVIWRPVAEGFHGRIADKACKIRSRHGDIRYITFDSLLSANAYLALEGGTKEDGTFAFGRKDGRHYRYLRLSQ